MPRIYLDHNATTPVRPEVREKMLPFLGELWGNPSSAHSFGQEVKPHVEEARARVSKVLGCSPGEVVFTSGGTESDNAAIKGVAYAAGRGHLVTTNIEHPAVLQTVAYLEKRGFNATYVPVRPDGVVDPGEVRRAIRHDTILVSVMHVNNEVGTIQPLREISAVTREAKVPLHTDAVQSFGKLPVRVDELGVDLLSLSGHKIYAPKGVGALYVRKGTRLDPLIIGGAQEKRRRSGTENVAGIVALGEAALLAEAEAADNLARWKDLRARFVEGLLKRVPEVTVNGDPARTLPNTLSASVRWVEGEGMMLSLDMEEIAVSTGSACSSGSLEPSHVLVAMGLSHEIAQGTLRFSLGRGTTGAEIDRVLAVLPPIVERLRRMSPIGPGRPAASGGAGAPGSGHSHD
jgi:cysteine desulfurase